MNKKNPVTKIGASLLVTFALITLTYLLLPNGRSVGAAPKAAARQTSHERTRRFRARRPKADAHGPRAIAALVRDEPRPVRPAGSIRFARRGLQSVPDSEPDCLCLAKYGSKQSFPGEQKTDRMGRTERPRRRLRNLGKTKAAQRAASKAVIRMSLVDSNTTAKLSGTDELPGKSQLLSRECGAQVVYRTSHFRKVSFAAVYPGIDLVFYGKGLATGARSRR